MQNNNKFSLTLMTVLLTGCGGSGDDPVVASDVHVNDTQQESMRPGTLADSPCTRESWAAGTTELCRGALIYYDYIYDDYGADGGLVSMNPSLLSLLNRGGQYDQPFANTPGLLSPAAGDQRYPEGLENTADLVRLSVAINGNRLVINAELNTMFNTEDAILGVAIDTDFPADTGGGHWGKVDVRSDGWDQIYFTNHGDPDSNIMSLTAPMPEGNRWRIQAAVAKADGTVMNVAFRGPHEEASADGAVNQVLPASGNFWEDRQAAALAGGDISEFGEVVNVSDLRQRVTRAAAKPTGFHQRVYTSDYPLGEGIAMPGLNGRDGGGLFCGQSFSYLGKYQPYGVYVPEGAETSTMQPGMMLVMHGCEANHASQINQSAMQRQFGDDLNRILVAPLGRGPYGFYTGPSERDVLDVMADMTQAYNIDSDRVFASGYSMGGFGALHMATHYPDRFAGMVSWVGHTGDLINKPAVQPLVDELIDTALESLLRPALAAILGSVADPQTGTENVIDYLGNLRHVPSAHLYGAADELVPIHEALAIAQRLAQAEAVDYHFYLHPVAEHLTLMALDDWSKEASRSAEWTRVSKPSRVSYLFDPRFNYPDFGIIHDKAYWVSDLRARNASQALLDLSAPGCGASLLSFATGNDLGAYPLPWAGSYRHLSATSPLPAALTLSGELSNVNSASVDLASVCLEGMAFHYDIDSDGPATLSLSDGRVLDLVAGRNQGIF
ncbi:prolyl oligopeptidase family serine peptidase [Marinobacter sp. SS21]|uniref:prolyl oligopeptidase family serine peptidase n=1 Tax=Marinobacter sp. SS21 TaxID=2979460 RepID=UPI00232FB513|nr:prolyl oligopeptidase family serine peptidase [Marinobacter sp. SS21]MDC0663410.1 prolyl oligopeptidase family serine peptidase [Marinobacter sp. SS21]